MRIEVRHRCVPVETTATGLPSGKQGPLPANDCIIGPPALQGKLLASMNTLLWKGAFHGHRHSPPHFDNAPRAWQKGLSSRHPQNRIPASPEWRNGRRAGFKIPTLCSDRVPMICQPRFLPRKAGCRLYANAPTTVVLATLLANTDLPPRLIPVSMLEFRGTQPWLPAGA